MKIGFVGLGIMGQPMVRNLMKAGYELVVYDRHDEKIEAVRKDGAKPAGSPKEAAQDCPVIITMLPNSPNVKEACLLYTSTGRIFQRISSIPKRSAA